MARGPSQRDPGGDEGQRQGGISVAVYGFRQKQRALDVARALCGAGIVPRVMFTVTPLAKVLAVYDAITGRLVYVKVDRWEPLMTDWNRDPDMFSMSLRARAQKAMRDHLTWGNTPRTQIVLTASEVAAARAKTDYSAS